MQTTDFHREGALADGPVRGRGAQLNPANRFERHRFAVDGDHLDDLRRGDRYSLPVLDETVDEAAPGEAQHRGVVEPRQVATEVQGDASRSVLNRVDSPDLGFRWTVNPYRGCEHGCVYCYARPTHETLGLSSGLDFETKIVAKPDAPRLLRKALSRPAWTGEPIVLSGVTDPYQPIESKMEITRRCLQEMVRARQPVSIITKSRMVLRDLDLLTELARHGAVRVHLSITTLDPHLAAKMEPRASAPRDRLWAVRRLASAGIPVGVMVAPIIPALNDREIPQLLQAAADAGARTANYVLLRLPHQNKALFEDWLAQHFPGRRDHVLNLLRQSRGGKLYDSEFHHRLTGEGPYARQISQTFDLFARRLGLDRQLPPLNRDAFRHPTDHEQLDLFGTAEQPASDGQATAAPAAPSDGLFACA